MKHQCPICEKNAELIPGAGTCKSCADAGWWIDPAGGVHYGLDVDDDDFDDPAKMYE